uniref:Uncharacterized protein n=1 Tax=Aegilops tauschii subsp. strangulata TaxID=200361 RepID=A0A453H606_AEGTS
MISSSTSSPAHVPDVLRILRKMLSWRDTDARTKSVMAFCCLTRERRLIHARNVAFLEMKKR